MQLIRDNSGRFYKIDEKNPVGEEDILNVIESEFEPTILDRYEVVEDVGNGDKLVIPDGQRVYFLNGKFHEQSALNAFVDYIDYDGPATMPRYPLLIRNPRSVTTWVAGPTDFASYKRQMRNLMFHYSKSNPAIVISQDKRYLGILKPGLSILPTEFGEDTDLDPIYYGDDPLHYGTQLPITDVLRERTEPYPLYIEDGYAYVEPRNADRVIWVSGIVPYNFEGNALVELAPYTVDVPSRTLYRGDTDIMY